MLGKKIAILVPLFALVATVSTSAMAQSTATEAADAKATIIKPISIAKTADLSFGKVVPAAAGTVSLSTSAERGVTGGTTIMSTQTGTVTAAAFTVTGEALATYTVTLPANDSVSMNGPGGATMAVNSFTSSVATSAGAGLLTSGTQELKVGATLSVGTAAAQTAGDYTGSFNVTVAYN